MVEILLDIGCSAQSLSTRKIINLGFFSIENNVIFYHKGISVFNIVNKNQYVVHLKDHSVTVGYLARLPKNHCCYTVVGPTHGQH